MKKQGLLQRRGGVQNQGDAVCRRKFQPTQFHMNRVMRENAYPFHLAAKERSGQASKDLYRIKQGPESRCKTLRPSPLCLFAVNCNGWGFRHDDTKNFPLSKRHRAPIVAPQSRGARHSAENQTLGT